MTINKENYSQAITDIENGLAQGAQKENTKIRDTFLKLNSSLKFEIKAKQFYAASQRVL